MPPDATSRYMLRDLCRDDFSLLASWLAEPHVAKWWGPVDVEMAAIEIAMGSRETRPMIAELEGRPIAYLQTYDPHLEDGHSYGDQPRGTLGIDLSIGPPDCIGQGHGSAIVRQLAAALFAGGTTRIVVDPDPRNLHAIRAYDKAGFRFLGRRDSMYGPAHFMALDAPLEDDAPLGDAQSPETDGP